MEDVNNTNEDLVKKLYEAALDSVNLINDLLAKEEISDHDKHTIWRNVEHLKIVVNNPDFDRFDMSCCFSAISAGESVTV